MHAVCIYIHTHTHVCKYSMYVYICNRLKGLNVCIYTLIFYMHASIFRVVDIHSHTHSYSHLSIAYMHACMHAWIDEGSDGSMQLCIYCCSTYRQVDM